MSFLFHAFPKRRFLTHFQKRLINVVQKTEYASSEDLSLLRNIGISAHIDSGKTTTTERILYYTGRIHEIHEVRGRDGVGAKMDSMELEREKGITIKSAATHTQWGKHHINIIDTPGHVDFTIEVERSLQVLDGAIMLVCASSGVQSQTITVDRQMRRYNVPRICFLNKCDRLGAQPYEVVDQIRKELCINCALLQIPIGLEEYHQGIIDLITQRAVYFDGARGEHVRYEEVPPEYKQKAVDYKWKLLEALGEVDEDMEMCFLEEKMPSIEEFDKKIRTHVLNNTFVPVFVGSAFKNKGVQLLLDGVVKYLPSPLDKVNYAKDEGGKLVKLSTDKSDALLMIAFKLEENKFGQLTWCRVYQGTLRKGMSIVANEHACGGGASEKKKNNKKIRLARIVRLHSSEMQDISQAHAGDICAMFGVDCVSGTTFSDGKCTAIISDLHVPNTVVALSVKPANHADMDAFVKACKRFQKEDPTFKVVHDTSQRNEIVFHGMGELHLQIYIERIEREYGVVCVSGKPRVQYKESITKKCDFDYTHKRQTGGAGQYAKIIGYMEPMEGVPNCEEKFEFVNKCNALTIPESYVKSVKNGFLEMLENGPLVGGKIEGLRVVLIDGKTHEVDSSDLAFKLAAQGAFRKYLSEMECRVSQPYMNIEVVVPDEFQASVSSHLYTKNMVINEVGYMGRNCVLKVYGPLDKMFGYAMEARSLTQGKAEFSMEYCDHQFVEDYEQEELVKEHLKFLAAEK